MGGSKNMLKKTCAKILIKSNTLKIFSSLIFSFRYYQQNHRNYQSAHPKQNNNSCNNYIISLSPENAFRAEFLRFRIRGKITFLNGQRLVSPNTARMNIITNPCSLTINTQAIKATVPLKETSSWQQIGRWICFINLFC